MVQEYVILGGNARAMHYESKFSAFSQFNISEYAIISMGAWTTRNCFRPSASLAVVLGTVGQGSWRLVDCRDVRTRLRNVTMI